jgi:hypothetical protein
MDRFLFLDGRFQGVVVRYGGFGGSEAWKGWEVCLIGMSEFGFGHQID